MFSKIRASVGTKKFKYISAVGIASSGGMIGSECELGRRGRRTEDRRVNGSSCASKRKVGFL